MHYFISFTCKLTELYCRCPVGCAVYTTSSEKINDFGAYLKQLNFIANKGTDGPRFSLPFCDVWFIGTRQLGTRPFVWGLPGWPAPPVGCAN